MTVKDRQYYRIMLGPKSAHADECYKGEFIGGESRGMNFDLSETLPELLLDFNERFIPEFLKHNPGKSRVSAGLACGMLHTICKGINIGDIVLCPNGKRAGESEYFVGEVIENYSYAPDDILPHRRIVKWRSKNIERSSMSKPLQGSTGAKSIVANISGYEDEIKSLLADDNESVKNPAVFALESHLGDFLVKNWAQTELGSEYDIFENGQQFQTDTGPIDILAIRKDKKEYLVIELKRGQATDKAISQLLRYMGFIEELAEEENLGVRGIIIASEDDLKLRRALKATKNDNIDFYRYQVTFKLSKEKF